MEVDRVSSGECHISKTVYSLELSVSLNFSMLPSASKKTNSSFFRFIGPKKWSAGLLQTSPTPLLWDEAEFRAVEKGLLSGRRSFFLVIWLSMVEG